MEQGRGDKFRQQTGKMRQTKRQKGCGRKSFKW
jgi:hypothetical protein